MTKPNGGGNHADYMQDAVTSLDRHLKSKRYTEESTIRSVVDAMMDDGRVRSTAGVGDFLARTHELASKSESVKVREQWGKLLIDLLGKRDIISEKAMEMEFDSDDLHVQMVGGMLDMIRKDEEFATAVMGECIAALMSTTSGLERLKYVKSRLSRHQRNVFDKDFGTDDPESHEPEVDPIEN